MVVHVTFIKNNGKKVKFDDCEDVYEAKSKFQSLFGYWPTDPTIIEEKVK